MLGEEFYSRRLPGGLEAWVWRRQGFQNRFAVFAARFGAMDARFQTGGEVFEVPDGTAHFLEHMAFETEQGNALGLFSRLGARANAFTSHAVTAYHFSAVENFWPALRRLAGLVVTTGLTPKGVEKERRVISQEIRMYEDSAEAKVFENLLQALYARNPIRRRIAGTVESVAGISPEILLRCHRTFYHPSNLVFAAAGDLEPEMLFDTLAKELRRLGADKPSFGFERLFPEEPPVPAEREVKARMSVKRPSFLVGFKDRPEGQDRFRRSVALNLLVEVVFGPTSPIYNDLYRDGLIDDSFSARYTSDRTFGYAVAGGTTRDADLASGRLLEGIYRWRQNGIEAGELERKRRKARGQYVGLFDSLEGLATLFLMHRLKGLDFLSYPRLLEEVTLEEVNQAFRELFVPERVSVSAVVPR